MSMTTSTVYELAHFDTGEGGAATHSFKQEPLIVNAVYKN